MGRLVVIEYVSVDGVVQAPGHPGEDGEGGFEHGGWTGPFMDEHRLFEDGGHRTDLRLVDAMTTRAGLVILTYEPAAG